MTSPQPADKCPIKAVLTGASADGVDALLAVPLGLTGWLK
jgi:hypothetical protein